MHRDPIPREGHNVATYYAMAVVGGTMTPQRISVEARSLREAKLIIEGCLGKIRRWPHTPVATRNPPPWYKWAAVAGEAYARR